MTITKRITGSPVNNSTRRVPTTGGEQGSAAQYGGFFWGNTWGGVWGSCWRAIHLASDDIAPAPAVMVTPRISGAPSGGITKRISWPADDPIVSGFAFLLGSGDYLLLESGDRVLLES